MSADQTGIVADFRRENVQIGQRDLLRSALEKVVIVHFNGDRNQTLVSQLFECIFESVNHELVHDFVSRSNDETAYVHSILAFREYLTRGAFHRSLESPITTVGENFDFLADRADRWSLLRVVNFLLHLSIQPSKRVAIVTSIRNEGLSILEWVAHHRALGFDEIFVYTNNNTDGSFPILAVLAQHGEIRLINNVVGSDVAPQVKGFEHSMHFLTELRQYEWAFYLDADEFFIPLGEAEFCLDGIFNKLSNSFGHVVPSAILFNWKWFGSENVVERSEGLLLERFVNSIENEHVKSLVRVKDVLSMRHLHYPVLLPGVDVIDSKFNSVNAAAQINPTYGCGQVNHYWNKSFHEFVIKKFRGRGAVDSKSPQRDFSMFFDWGVNGKPGRPDNPPETVMLQTKKKHRDLSLLPGMQQALADVNRIFVSTIAELDSKLDLKAIFSARGRI